MFPIYVLKLPSYCRLIAFMGPDHLQLTLLNWDTESVLALNKKLKVNLKFQFLSSAKTLLLSQIE